MSKLAIQISKHGVFGFLKNFFRRKKKMIILLLLLALSTAQVPYYVEYYYTDSACLTQPRSAFRITTLDSACQPKACALLASSNPPLYKKTTCDLSYSSLGADFVGHCPATPMTQWSSVVLNRCLASPFSKMSYVMTNCLVGTSVTEVTYTGTYNCSGVAPTTTVIALNSCINSATGFGTWFSCTNNTAQTTTSNSRTTAPAAAASLTGVVGFAFLILSILF
jgi:hypothetical protein